MKGFASLLFLLLPGFAFADLKLEAEFQPEFKLSRVRAFLNEGAKADFRYVVHNDGSVRDISVTYSDHPKLTELIKSDVALWRYKPWPLKNNPATVAIAHSVFVTFNPNLKRTIRIKVLNMRCRELNREVTRFRKSNPEKPLYEMDAFAELRWVSQVSYDESTVAEVSQWHEIFRDAFPAAVESCQENPGAMYIKYLPDVLRERIQSSPRRETR
jgi:hypothetical protein